MKSSNGILAVIFICFLVVNAGGYFVLYAPLISQYQTDKNEIEYKNLQKSELNQQKQSLANFANLKMAYESSNQLYEHLAINMDNSKSYENQRPEAADIDLFFNLLGLYTIGNDSVRPKEIPQDVSAQDANAYVPYKKLQYKIDTYMNLIQFSKFLAGLAKSSDEEFLKQIPYNKADRNNILKPKVIIIKRLELLPTESTVLEDTPFATLEDPIQVSIEVDYIYFVKS